MASIEVMRDGVNVAAAVLLTVKEMPSSLEKEIT
jgi:hypothetical protein